MILPTVQEGLAALSCGEGVAFGIPSVNNPGNKQLGVQLLRVLERSRQHHLCMSHIGGTPAVRATILRILPKSLFWLSGLVQEESAADLLYVPYHFTVFLPSKALF